MGDTCYINISILKKDQDTFGEIFEEDPEEWYDDVDLESDLHISVTGYEADYAWYEELEKAADRGMVFFGHHGAGGNYGAGAFVSIDGQCDYIHVDEQGHPVARVHEDGEIDGDQYFCIMDHYKRQRRAEEIILGKKSDP